MKTTEFQREKLKGHVPMPSTQTGGGCLVFFSLPFIAVGVGLILVTLGYIPIRNGRTADAPPWILTSVGGVFAAAGLGLAWSGIAGMLRARSAKRRREEHPLEPWYWDHPWDSKGATSGGIGSVLQTFVAFVIFSAFLAPFNWWAFLSKEGPFPVKLIVSLFDLFALLILAGAFYGLSQYLKYGKSLLHFERFPFRPGSSVEAGLEAHRRLAQAPVIVLHLRYIEEVTETHGHGKNRSTTTVLYCLHETKQELTAGQFDANSGVDIPIRIRLPEGDYANRLLENPRRYWELHVMADTPGVDYEARFLLPVY